MALLLGMAVVVGMAVFLIKPTVENNIKLVAVLSLMIVIVMLALK